MSTRSMLDDLKLFLAHMQGVQLRDVEVRGLVPGEDPRGYASLLREAMERAWCERGKRPLPPDYEPPPE